MEMEDNYGMMDLVTHSMDGRPALPAMPQPPGDLHYAMLMLGEGGNGGGVPFGSDHSTMGGMGSATSDLRGDSGSGGGAGCGGGGTVLDMEIGGRWPKEETLALLDIRARLDSKFKEAGHKGQLWDEVSRMMCGEHGYKRSGKKCSEKFENLHKYYKKIKEGKAGRQDKKHYRFYHQLEAISGETSTNLISVTNATSPPFLEDHHLEKTITESERMMGRKRWKTKITEFIETKMNTLMEKQDKWMEKVMNTIEERERERVSKEKQWRKEEAARLERERKFRSSELARMERREVALMEALHRLTKIESIAASRTEYRNDQDQIVTGWRENETAQLIQLRTSMETRFEKGGLIMEGVLWEEIAMTMASLGYNRSALICRAKWDHINFVSRNKKQKRCSNSYLDHQNHIFDHQAGERFIAFNNEDIRDDGNMVLMRDPHEMMWNYYGKIEN